MASYVVKSALVIAKDDEGRQVYLYQGAVVPSSINKDEVTRLQDGGFIEALSEPTEPEAAKLPTAGKVESAKK